MLAIASPKGGSGKTTISLNLAMSLARQERSVILVDADVNGDVLSAIQGRERAVHGALDVLSGRASTDDALLRTMLPNFKIMPALGQDLPDPEAFYADHTSEWQRMLAALSEQAEIVIVDCPAGMFGPTRQIMGACTHLLGVLQAELIASRSFTMFSRALEAAAQGRAARGRGCGAQHAAVSPLWVGPRALGRLLGLAETLAVRHDHSAQ